MAPRNGLDTKIAVLGEQVTAIQRAMQESKEDDRTWRTELKTELTRFHTDIDQKLDHHEESDQKNFKAIDDRLAMGDKVQAGQAAVEKYKRWLFGAGGVAVATILWNVIKAVTPLFPFTR
jgi:hypothetical protein